MKIMITGATGYIGHKLALAAANRNYIVHILVRDIQSKFLPVHPNIVPFKGDITEKETVAEAMAGCEKVIHAAAIAKFTDKDNSVFYQVNVGGTKNVLDTALKFGIKKLVFTSTGAVLGPSGKNPVCESDPRTIAFENDYEISKHWAEQIVKEYARKGLFAIIVAAPRVYGPGLSVNGNVFGRLIGNVLSSGLAFMPADKEVVANYAFIDDVVEGHFLAMEKGLGGEKYILGGENISYSFFFNSIRKNAGKKIQLITIPAFLLKVFSLFYMVITKLRGKETNISPKVIQRILQNRALSCDKAIKQLGYTITPFSEGIRQTILHLQNKSYGL